MRWVANLSAGKGDDLVALLSETAPDGTDAALLKAVTTAVQDLTGGASANVTVSFLSGDECLDENVKTRISIAIDLV